MYAKEVSEVVELLASSLSGLPAGEHDKRLGSYGPNKLKEKKQKSIWEILLSQVNNPVVYLLVAAVIVSLIFGDIPESIAIAVVIVLNTIIGFWMELQARQSMESLHKIDRISADIMLDGEQKEIDAEELVPGDVLLLKAGDIVAADARVFEAAELQIDESPLTGESVPVEKKTDKIEENTPVADRVNMVFKGTSVTGGKGKALVTGTGMQTEIGNISEMVSNAGDENIPLNRKLKKLTKSLIWVITALAALFFVVGWAAGKELYIMLQTAIAWTIAAIPEGLPIVASIALARGMLRLSKQHVLVKKLAAVETLGEVTMIFTDKTGTLTENKLSLQTLLIPDEGEFQISYEGDKGKPRIDNLPEKQNSETFDHFFRISVLCNNASISGDGDSDGDPLEIALLRFAESYDSNYFNDLRSVERITEDPFDSETKMMGTIHEVNNKLYLSAKGAARAILSRSTGILKGKNTESLDEKEKEFWLKENDRLSGDGLRVLAYGYRIPQGEKSKFRDKEEFVEDLIFVGLVCFIDPPRKDIRAAIEKCHAAGIVPVMVTGDHPGTARNIAQSTGLVNHDPEPPVVHGNELEEYFSSHQQSDSRVFARVDPAQKLDIVDFFQKAGEIVGMTGDGVNDAPALKKADIGIAMGKRGTQVAREVSDMILQEDSFPSIVQAVEEGRIIFGNIRKFIMYQLSYHLSEIVVIALISFTLFNLPLLPLQLLFLNLLSDVFPALALGLGKGTPGVMQNPPKNPEEPIITRRNWVQTGIYGLIIAGFVTGGYLFAYNHWQLSKEISNNVAFFSLAFAQLLHVFSMRESDEGIFINQITRNKYIWWALVFCFAAIITAYLIPGLHTILSFEKLQMKTWILIGVTSLSPILVIQIMKIFYGKWLKNMI